MYPQIDRDATGKQIAFLMKEKGLTPYDVQEYLSLSCVQTVYKWINGKSIPSIESLYALCVLFGVSLDSIVKGDKEIHHLKRLLEQDRDKWT